VSALRWFYILLFAAGIALITLGLERLLDLPRPFYLQVIVAISILIVIVSILVLNSKHVE